MNIQHISTGGYLAIRYQLSAIGYPSKNGYGRRWNVFARGVACTIYRETRSFPFRMSLGSANELEYHLLLSHDVGLLLGFQYIGAL